MNWVAFLDIIAMTSCGFAAYWVIRGWKISGFNIGLRLLILALAGLVFLYACFLFLEWSHLTHPMENTEDLIGAFLPMLWAFLFYAFVRNIYETDLLESRERFRAITETTSDWIWETDAKGTFTYSNPGAKKLLGYDSEQVLGKTLFDFTSKDHQIRFRKRFQRISSQSVPLVQVRVRAIRRDGHKVYLEISGMPFFDGSTLIGYRGISRDVTERRNSEKAIEKLNTQFAEKNEELEAILYAAAHDLRAPLVNLDGFGHILSQSAEELSEKLNAPPIRQQLEKSVLDILDRTIPEAVGFINISLHKINDLISGLLKVSRLPSEKSHPQNINMNKLASAVAASFEYTIRELGATVDIRPMPPCFADPGQITRVFLNLVSNAIMYRQPDRPLKITIRGKTNANRSVYCVEDNGIGIAPEHQSKIFLLFHRLEPGKKIGEGIGLTIAKRILARNNGQIWVSSEPDKGSRFYVSLPLSDRSLETQFV
ncbi:MAG: PAS domain S-box protein [Phycisphaerae bacterium]|nr:PAS domain S-box protein [Phycisphaerae bacterium]